MQKQGASKRRQDRQRDKEVNRVERRKEKHSGGMRSTGEDPDLAGIVPGPQPSAVD